MRIALVDDDRNDRTQLRAYIQDFFQVLIRSLLLNLI